MSDRDKCEIFEGCADYGCADICKQWYGYRQGCYREGPTEAPRPQDSSGSNELTGCVAKGKKELNRLLWAVNKITAPHRHGGKVTKKALDNLANRQLEYLDTL